LLGARREELRRYLRERGLNWREDVSNSDPAFARARVRELLAAAGTIHPAAIDNVLRTADELRAESIALDAIVAELLANALDVEGESLQVAALAQLPAALQALVLREFVERAAGRPVPDARRQAARIVELAAGGGSSTLQIEGAELIVEYGKLRVARESPEMPAIEVKLAVPGTAEFGSWIVEASIGEAALPPAGVDTATFGASTLASILTVRPRRDGDRMRPRGLGGSKSLQDLFVDHKVPKRLRDRHPVICSGDEIIWIPGVAVADGYAPTDGSDTAVLSARA
jgi:tRNA(Ile)-lysidine synthase